MMTRGLCNMDHLYTPFIITTNSSSGLRTNKGATRGNWKGIRLCFDLSTPQIFIVYLTSVRSQSFRSLTCLFPPFARFSVSRCSTRIRCCVVYHFQAWSIILYFFLSIEFRIMPRYSDCKLKESFFEFKMVWIKIWIRFVSIFFDFRLNFPRLI